jgi:broad specificity phosphatase PhoE
MDLLAMQGHYWYRYPQGENIPDVRARCRSWMSTLTRDHAGRRVLAISHHITILSHISNMKRMNAAAFLEMDATRKPRNSSSTEFICGDDGAFKLHRYNDQLF